MMMPDRPEPPEEIQLPDDHRECHNWGCSGVTCVTDRNCYTQFHFATNIDVCECHTNECDKFECNGECTDEEGE